MIRGTDAHGAPKALRLSFALAGMLLAWTAALMSEHAMAANGQRHVVMISIDGLRPEIYLDPEGLGVSVPNLVELSRQGAHAERMIPVFPSVTYPGHTTLATGVYPATHGVVANYKRDGGWYLQSSDIKSETLWQAAQRQGFSVGIVTWPASYGAEVDFLIPENLGSGESDTAQLIRSGSTPGLFEALEQQFGKVRISPIETGNGGEELDRMTARFAAEILKQHKPDLLLIHLVNADHQQHAYGPASPEAMLAFEAIDRQIGAIMEAARKTGIAADTTFVIVGDHGFLPVHTNINVNGFLADIGFGGASPGGSVQSPDVIALPFGGGAAFYLNDPADKATASRLIDAAKTELQSRYSGRIEFISRSGLDRLHALPEAAFALVAAPGFMFTSAREGSTLIPARARGMHGYLPSRPEMATGLIVAGGGVPGGISLGEVHMVDVAPTVAALLGIALPEAEGRPIAGVLPRP